MEQEWQRYYQIGEQAERERNYALAEASWAVAALLSEQCNDGSKRLAYCLDHLGHALFKQRKFAASRCFLERSWKLRLQSPDHTLLDRAATLNLIAELSFAEGNLAQAERLCLEVFRVFESKLGNENPRTQAAERNYMSVRQLHARSSTAESTTALKPSQPPPPLPKQAETPPAPAQAPAQATPNTAPSDSPSSPATTKPKAEYLNEKCEKCGQKMYGDECLRCTGTSMKAISPYDRLT